MSNVTSTLVANSPTTAYGTYYNPSVNVCVAPHTCFQKQYPFFNTCSILCIMREITKSEMKSNFPIHYVKNDQQNRYVAKSRLKRYSCPQLLAIPLIQRKFLYLAEIWKVI